ncbi:hypothetical protein CY34DRAFT_550580 [Suillus luteus UH-Slu-Lm8-n1]|uniref:Uncharacterized protein n=1 Tax=Suillus luteus UH-Slu-Lm8-n1 TaxID=930992 RepID=A0A0D0AVP0_9AGAM|nr:hypothetical protein CY34DRAFT_550580 [Suillus luteus UH-Slu-Lm8-n1]
MQLVTTRHSPLLSARKLLSHPHEPCVSLWPSPWLPLSYLPLLLSMKIVLPIAILTANAVAAMDDCIVASSTGASKIPERLIVDSVFEGEGDIWI